MSARERRRAGVRRRAGLLLSVLAVPLIACGVKGPPLPPLVRLPVAPAELTAERRGDRVELRFVVPAENTDGSRPANIERVDVYALTGPTKVSDAVLLRRGTRIASVAVKAPRDPDETVEPGDPISDVDPPQGAGLDQGAVANVHENLGPASLEAVDLTDTASSGDAKEPTPVLDPAEPPLRTFIGVGISTRGRRGPLSRRVSVVLAPAPPAPAQPTITYDEVSMTVTWAPPVTAAPEPAPPSGVAPATAVGGGGPAIAYQVYDVTPPVAKSGAGTAAGKETETAAERRLTKNPITERQFVDKRVEWGVERCYTVRVVQTFDGSPVESDAAPPRCATPTDTFPPAAPTGINPIPSEGAITLIWNPSTESDLAGYIVSRARVPAGALIPVTPSPIQLTTFRDTVAPGVRFVYAVRAIDKAGNVSPESARVEEAAR